MQRHPASGTLAILVAPVVCVLTTFCLLIFPDGRMVLRSSPIILAVSTVLFFVRYLFFPHFSRPDGVVVGDAPGPLVAIILYLMAISGIIGGAWAQVYRWLRVSDTAERQRTKWIQFGGSLGFAGVVLFQIPALMLPELREPGVSRVMYTLIGLPTFYFSFSFLPLGIVLSALRYRLWDIDAVINRSLVYGALTASLLFVYLSIVGILQSLFKYMTGQQSTLAVAASTLTIAILFNPLRQRLQKVIDRGLYPRTVDLREAIAAFAREVRTMIGLPALLENLVQRTTDLLEIRYGAVYLYQRDHGADIGKLVLSASQRLPAEVAEELPAPGDAGDWEEIREKLRVGQIVSRTRESLFPLLVPLLTPERSGADDRATAGRRARRRATDRRGRLFPR